MTDTAKKFRLLVTSDGAKASWWETYVEVTDNPLSWGKETIAYYNNTLRPGEKRRTLLAVELIEDELAPVNHAWEKQNLFTRYHIGSARAYDDMKCTRCGVRGKRFGLGENVKRVNPFRPNVYARCDTALAHMKKKGDATQ